jgi:hypothetical protein
MWQNREATWFANTEVTSPMLSDMKQQLSEYEDRADKLGRRL